MRRIAKHSGTPRGKSLTSVPSQPIIHTSLSESVCPSFATWPAAFLASRLRARAPVLFLEPTFLPRFRSAWSAAVMGGGRVRDANSADLAHPRTETRGAMRRPDLPPFGHELQRPPIHTAPAWLTVGRVGRLGQARGHPLFCSSGSRRYISRARSSPRRSPSCRPSVQTIRTSSTAGKNTGSNAPL